MKTITLLEFRKNTEAILQEIPQGKSVVLTRRGRPVAPLHGTQHLDIQ
ncbi:MAG: type II toxin-antitoxin system Phd/YefM family antitoxin [Deltaproteobacteria bacterium]|nr:type II toxin-antitoxin system Phd/YefM family antitoxin [Deltaproteobacteria bacterium]